MYAHLSLSAPEKQDQGPNTEGRHCLTQYSAAIDLPSPGTVATSAFSGLKREILAMRMEHEP